MQIEQMDQSGKRKLIERKVSIKCLMCGDVLVCPPGSEEWSWLGSAAVADFKTAHYAHGNERTVGAEIQFVEKE